MFQRKLCSSKETMPSSKCHWWFSWDWKTYWWEMYGMWEFNCGRGLLAMEVGVSFTVYVHCDSAPRSQIALQSQNACSGAISFQRRLKTAVFLRFIMRESPRRTKLVTQKQQALLLISRLCALQFASWFIAVRPQYENERHPNMHLAIAVQFEIEGRITVILPEIPKGQMWMEPKRCKSITGVLQSWKIL